MGRSGRTNRVGNTKLISPLIGRKHAIPRVPQVVNVPRFNNADIDWYVRIPTDSPPTDPKVKMLPELCQEYGATLKLTLPVTVSTLKWVGKYTGRRFIPCMLARFKVWQLVWKEN